MTITAFTADSPLVILGCGKMGGALLDGWLAQGLPKQAVRIVDPAPAEALLAMGISIADSVDAITETPKAVLIAIKPQMMAEVLPGVAGRFGDAPLYMSIAAGTSLADFRALLGQGIRAIRVMPNTPVAVGKGASALFASDSADADERALAEEMMSAVGEVVWLDTEAQMDAVTGVSGSGPAYVFHMIEALAAAAAAQGLAPDLAMRLARQTVIGAAALADASDETAENLRVNVTSPKGTTAAALEHLMDGESGMTPLMTRAVAASADRSRALSGNS